MKRLAIIVVMTLMSLTASANSIRFFTYSQAARTVQYLNAQNEMMIYCGYDYEIETYVLVNEVWMERYNSGFYEIWVYGYDAYTGEEIYMPLDLGCVWLFSGGRIYSAAQYLRFHANVSMPSFTWHIPAYNHYTRVVHRPGYTVTYHYTVHQHGWMPPAPGQYGPSHAPLPPYYNRAPHTPAPQPVAAWTPGVNRPQIASGNSTNGVQVTNDARPTTSSHSTAPSTGRPGSGSGTGSISDRSSSSAVPGSTSRSNSSATTSSSRGNNSATTSSSRSNNSATTSSSRSNSSATTSSSRSNSSATTSSSRSNSSATTSSSRSNSSAGTSTGTTNSRPSNAGTTPTRANATGTTTRVSSESSATQSTIKNTSATPARTTNTRSSGTTTTSRSGNATTTSRQSTTAASSSRTSTSRTATSTATSRRPSASSTTTKR